MGATYDPGLTTPGMLDPTVLLLVVVVTLIVYVLNWGGRR